MNLKSFHITKYKVVIFLIIAFVWSSSIICNSCNNNNTVPVITHSNGKQFAGSETCKSCHKNIAESHLLTGHFRSSRPADAITVRGSFEAGKNVFELNPHVKVIMEKHAGGLFQEIYINGREAVRLTMDIVIGYDKGQTYLYWNGNKLFQLPISYYPPLNEWCNSPGFPTDQIMVDRPFLCAASNAIQLI